MRDTRVEYVHVINNETEQSVSVIKCGHQPAERVARGLEINLNHAQYYVRVSYCGHPMADAFLCLECAAGGIDDAR